VKARGRIEGSDASVGSTNEAVAIVSANGVAVRPSDHSAWVDASGRRGCGARHIERGEGSTRRPEEAMRHAACVVIPSDDRSVRSNGANGRKCGARWIERDEVARECGSHEEREDQRGHEFHDWRTLLNQLSTVSPLSQEAVNKTVYVGV